MHYLIISLTIFIYFSHFTGKEKQPLIRKVTQQTEVRELVRVLRHNTASFPNAEDDEGLGDNISVHLRRLSIVRAEKQFSSLSLHLSFPHTRNQFL